MRPRAGLRPLLVEGMQPGGQMTITTEVENFPGFADVIQGPWLMEQMREQALKVGTEMRGDLIVKAELRDRPFSCTGDSGTVYTADAVIIATGAEAKWLGLPSEQQFRGFGVSACATCDGFFFRGKEVVVVGGGNTAVEEALYLTHHATKVTLVHRRDRLRAEKIMQERLFRHEKVDVVWDSVVEEILGTTEPLDVTGVRLRNVNTGETRDLTATGLFVAIGHRPNTDVFKGQITLDDEGYIVTAPDQHGNQHSRRLRRGRRKG